MKDYRNHWMHEYCEPWTGWTSLFLFANQEKKSDLKSISLEKSKTGTLESSSYIPSGLWKRFCTICIMVFVREYFVRPHDKHVSVRWLLLNGEDIFCIRRTHTHSEPWMIASNAIMIRILAVNTLSLTDSLTHTHSPRMHTQEIPFKAMPYSSISRLFIRIRQIS